MYGVFYSAFVHASIPDLILNLILCFYQTKHEHKNISHDLVIIIIIFSLSALLTHFIYRPISLAQKFSFNKVIISKPIQLKIRLDLMLVQILWQ